MSEEQVRWIRESYADAGASRNGSGDRSIEQRALFASLAERTAPTTEFDFSHVYPDGPVLRGLEAVRRFRDDGPWEVLRFRAERVLEVGEERVLVLVTAVAEGKGSGIPVLLHNAHEFTFSNGTLVRFKVYGDQRAALEAAGVMGA
jgi:hypothetical protein